MNVFVTGGAGQLGTLVLRRLIADRKVKRVITLDKRPPSVASPKVETVIADIRDLDIGRYMAGADALIHLAFVVTGYLPRAEFDAINVGGSRNVFEAAAAAGITRIVYSSSVAAYGCVPGHPQPLVETTPRVHHPTFPYSATKFEVEAFLDTFERAHPGIAVARLRPSILVGTHMDHALGDALRRRVLPDTGTTPLPIVWDDDVADAAMLALKHGGTGARGAFNLTAGELLPAAALARATGLRLVPSAVLRALALVQPLLARAKLARPMDPAWAKEGAVPMVMSTAKAEAELGWKPKCPTAVDVLRRHRELAPTRLDPRLALFFRAVDLAARHTPPPDEAKHLSTRIHLALTGPNGGDFGIVVDDGRLAITRVAPRPPSSVITLPADTLLELLAGRGDVSSAQFTGKIRVEGAGEAGLLLGGIVSTFRAEAARPGPRGLFARGMSRWFRSTGRRRWRRPPAGQSPGGPPREAREASPSEG